MVVLSNFKYESDLTLPDGSANLLSRLRAQSQITGLSISSLSNGEPAGDQNDTIPIRISGTRKYGIIARHIIIYRLAGDSPNQYREYRRIPILQPDTFIQYLSAIPSTIGYEGSNDWVLVGGMAERYHLLFGPAT